jgi:hypothetical protein
MIMAPIRELASNVPPTPSAWERPATKPATATHDEGPSPFARLVRGFAGEADRGESSVRTVLAAGRSNVPLDPTSLLALQAGIYRYGETMDLAAQLVDKASTGMKTIVQGQ